MTDDQPSEESRRHPRVPVRFQVQYTGRNTTGTAYARDISVGGALLEQAEPLLVAGGRVRLRFSLFPDSLPIEVGAEVVRETPEGFAVRFTSMDPRLRAVLRRSVAKAIVDAEKRARDEEEDLTLLTTPKL